MSTETYNLISAVFWAITMVAGLATVVVYGCQLRVMQKTLKSMNQTLRSQVSADLTAKLNEYNQIELAHPEVKDFYSHSFDPDLPGGHVGSLISDMRFAVLEEAYAQFKKYEMMDEHSWRVWRRLLEFWIRHPFFPGYWQASRDYFHPDFVELVDTLYRNQKGATHPS